MALSACGGGGGSSGNTEERYSITLRADKTTLPVNVGHIGVGQGVAAPYSTTLYVSAKEGDDPIQGGEEIFACNMAGGLDTGSLYYLDGDDDHEDDDGNPLAYRSIVLGANAGGASFHFHAWDQAGTSTITCSVTDPRDSRVYSASVDITVGGGTGTGRAASVYAVSQSYYLGSRYNLYDLPASVGINAIVMDDAVQPVPNPSAANVRIRIVQSTGAAVGATLLLGAQSGTEVNATTSGGVALFSLSSGASRGTILLELTADRYDNDVTNGIQTPIVQWTAIPVVDGLSTALAFENTEFSVTNGTYFAGALEVTEGGTPPYTWTILSGSLPSGMSLTSSGIVQGTPLTTAGSTHVVRVRVTDVYGYYTEGTVTITVTGSPITVSTSTVSANTGVPFSYALTASGGVAPYTWAALGTMPAGLTLSPTGVISGTPTLAGTYRVAVQVTDRTGATATTNVTITVGVALAISTTNIDATTGVSFSYALQAVGGVSPYTWTPLGTWPGTVTMGTDGVISGTLAPAGAYTLPIQIEDAAGTIVTGNIVVGVVDP
ncbi:MAG: Ig domain-containing protein [Ottowia sp.]